MIEHIESLLVPSVYNKIRKSTNDMWNNAKTLPIELSDLVIESDGLYFKFEKTRRGGELQLKHTFIDAVTLKPGNEINTLLPDAEKMAITKVVSTIDKPPNTVTTYDLTQDNTGDVITWVENHIQYWRCKSKPILNRISKSLFYNYQKVTDVSSILSIVDTTHVVDIQSMFNHCDSIESLDLSWFDTSNVTNMRLLFAYCTSLSYLHISNFNTSKVTNISNMFANCSALTLLDLTNFDISNVQTMVGVFIRCGKLYSINISNWNTSNTTNMDSLFSGCGSLRSLNLSSFNTSKTTTMSSMFSSCNAMIEYGPNFVNTSISSLSAVDSKNRTYNMFSSSTANKPSWDNPYSYWSSTGQFVISSGLLPGSNIQSAINGNATQFIKSATQPESTTTTTSISTENGVAVTWYDAATTTQYWWSKYEVVFMNPDSSNMFSSHRGLTSISLVGFSGRYILDMRYLFDTCINLQRIDGLEMLETPIVTSIDSMFYDCSSLVSIQFSDKFDTSHATSLWNMFYGCESLTTLDVSMFKTGNVTSMNQTFANCFKLTSLDLSSFDTSNVTGMGAMFYTCRSLTTLTLSSKFKTEKSTSFSSMFCGCTNLTSLDLSSFNTSSAIYMDNMFKDCTSLFILDLSMFDTTKVTTMEGMFYKCVINGLGISTFNTVNVTNMRQMFYDTPNVLNIGFGPNFVFTAMQHLTSPDSTNDTYQMMYNCTASGPWHEQGKFDSNGTFTLNTVTNLMDGPSINNSLNRMNATSFTRSTTPPDTGGGSNSN